MDPKIPRPRDAENTRTAILDAAEDIFATRGFAGARIEVIATASGYNNGLIFRYFTDKVGLYRAVVLRMKARAEQRFAQELAPLFRDRLDQAADVAVVRQVIASAVRWVFDFYAENPRDRRILAWEAADGWQTFLLVHAGYDQSWWIEPVTAFVSRAREAGAIRSSADIAMSISNVLFMALIYQSFVPRYQIDFPSMDFTTASALRRAREEIVALILDGMITDHSPTTAGGTAAGTSDERNGVQ